MAKKFTPEEIAEGERRWPLAEMIIEEETAIRMREDPNTSVDLALVGSVILTAWYNDKCVYHRTDGPAVSCTDGSKCWVVDGKLHRLDGPAVEYGNSSGIDKDQYFIKGVEISESNYKKLTVGDIKDLPLYLGLGFDDLILERLKKDECPPHTQG